MQLRSGKVINNKESTAFDQRDDYYIGQIVDACVTHPCTFGVLVNFKRENSSLYEDGGFISMHDYLSPKKYCSGRFLPEMYTNITFKAEIIMLDNVKRCYDLKKLN